MNVSSDKPDLTTEQWGQVWEHYIASHVVGMHGGPNWYLDCSCDQRWDPKR